MTNHQQKIAAYLELDYCKKWINHYIKNNQLPSAVKMIDRRMLLKQVIKDKITITKFMSTLTSAYSRKRYTELFKL